MWKPVLFAISVGLLAGCISINVTDTPETRPTGGAETCDAGQYKYLVGQAEESIDRTHLPKAYRVICAECMVTMDFNPNRLNIHLGTDKRVGSVRCG